MFILKIQFQPLAFFVQRSFILWIAKKNSPTCNVPIKFMVFAKKYLTFICLALLLDLFRPEQFQFVRNSHFQNK